MPQRNAQPVGLIERWKAYQVVNVNRQYKKAAQGAITNKQHVSTAQT